ncbi:MAG TPA: helix-turn-helix domain-containing protein, partial [Cytophagales bacterium]
HVLTMLIKEYEDQQVHIKPADPVDVIKFVMEQQDLKQVDLAPLMGGKNRVSEVLSRKRALTLDMIRKLSQALHIPLEALVGI